MWRTQPGNFPFICRLAYASSRAAVRRADLIIRPQQKKVCMARLPRPARGSVT